jgi:hypothetical protein
MIFNFLKIIVLNIHTNIIFVFCKLLLIKHIIIFLSKINKWCLIKHTIIFLSKLNILKPSYTLKDVMKLTLLIRKLLVGYFTENLVDHIVVAPDK